MEQTSGMRINLLFGFLGSGKTTLLRRILAERGGTRPMAVIVNEFGEVGVDGDIIAGKNVDLVELTSGCLCCTLRGSLMSAVEELKERAGVEHIVVEATGVASPGDMLEDLLESKVAGAIDVAPLVTVVDAPKFTRLQQMLGEFYEEQVENADVLVLNKIDLASAEELDAAHAAVRELNPEATLLFAEQGDVDLPLLLDGDASALVEEMATETLQTHGHEHAEHHAHQHHHAPADSFVFEPNGSFDGAQLHTTFDGLPADVWRAKGFVIVDGRWSLLQFTTGQLEFADAEPHDNARLVVIGRDLDRNAIETRLRAALQREGQV